MHLQNDKQILNSILLTPENEKMAIKLSAFSILLELRNEGILSEEEITHIKNIYKIPIEM